MIYFVRHGESQANLDQVFGGPHYPAPLTPKGREQARLAGEHIKQRGLVIDGIVASTLPRAKDTAEIIAATIGFDPAGISYDPRLIEYDMGDLSGQPLAGVNPHERISAPNAEKPSAFQERVVTSLAEIRTMPGNILIVSHAGVGRIIEATRLGIAPENFYEVPGYPNAQIVELKKTSAREDL